MQYLPMLLLFALLGLMMYFMSRRQRRAQQQQQDLQNSLNVGDRVMTTSGLYGIITDTSDDSKLTIEIAPGMETEWLRAAVREKVDPETAEDMDDVDDTVDELDEDLESDETDELVDEVEDDREVEPSVESGNKK